MIAENSTWRAPRIHGELKMLGFDLSERTVLRWMRKAPRNLDSAKRWAAFFSNHREAITAMDFFTVPTLTFGVLTCFFVIAHDGGACCTSALPVIGKIPTIRRGSKSFPSVLIPSQSGIPNPT